jgi:hypothetical protein
MENTGRTIPSLPDNWTANNAMVTEVHQRESSEMERPLYQRGSSGLPMQLFGVEIHSFLPHR